ncbi:MAG: SAM-dependent methyltransferase, partial [Microcystis panniformis]
YQNQPVIFDDTVYFLSFDDLDTAQKTLQLLNSSLGREFYSSLIFWDEKRPIKTRILNSLNLSVLAEKLLSYKL